MTKTAYSVVVFLLVCAAFLAGTWYSQGTHPTEVAAANVAAPAGTGAQAPGAGITVTPEHQQLIGIRTQAVESAGGTRVVRLLGRVTPDDAKIFRVNAGIDGTLHDVSPFTVGSHVKRDQVLATFTAPGAVPIFQLFILNSGAMNRAKLGPTEGQNALALADANLRQRLDQLESIGVSPQQIREIAEAEEFPKSIRILAPADGVVLNRNVSPGLKFEKGMEFFRIADLRKVWILADVFENEAQYLKPGARAELTLPGQTKTLAAVVENVLPRFDATARTLKVRLEADNPGDVLIPDMFVDVTLSVALSSGIVVPADALLDAGIHKTVFVQTGPARFEPRNVETGWRHDGRVEILRGLSGNEKVVTSGTFLLESEARMKRIAGSVQVRGNGPDPEPSPGGNPTGHDHSHHHP